MQRAATWEDALGFHEEWMLKNASPRRKRVAKSTKCEHQHRVQVEIWWLAKEWSLKIYCLFLYHWLWRNRGIRAVNCHSVTFQLKGTHPFFPSTILSAPSVSFRNIWEKTNFTRNIRNRSTCNIFISKKLKSHRFPSKIVFCHPSNKLLPLSASTGSQIPSARGAACGQLLWSRYSSANRPLQAWQRRPFFNQRIVGCTPGPTYPVMGNPKKFGPYSGYLWVPKNP